MKIVIFMQASYHQRQMIEAMTCPLNRHGTREEYGCDDWGLFKNPQWLMDHYIKCGGAAAFAARRAEFLREVVIPDDPMVGVEI